MKNAQDSGWCHTQRHTVYLAYSLLFNVPQPLQLSSFPACMLWLAVCGWESTFEYDHRLRCLAVRWLHNCRSANFISLTDTGYMKGSSLE